MVEPLPPTVPQWIGTNHDVWTHINYFPRDIGGMISASAVPPPKRADGRLHSGRMMTVTNISGRESDFQIDRNGFEIVALPPMLRDMTTDALIESRFYPEMEQVIKSHTGASFVFPLGHVLRRPTNEIFQEKKDTERYNRYGAIFPHCDGPVAIPERLQQLKQLAMQSPAIIKNDHAKTVDKAASRWAMIQIWKPLNIVERDPLAICDVLSYQHSDWRLRLTPSPSTGYSVLTHPDGPEMHRWYYVHGMTPDQMFLFKGCDSRQGQPGFTGYAGAHTAITVPDSNGKSFRESIEARFLCFWVEEGIEKEADQQSVR